MRRRKREMKMSEDEKKDGAVDVAGRVLAILSVLLVAVTIGLTLTWLVLSQIIAIAAVFYELF